MISLKSFQKCVGRELACNSYGVYKVDPQESLSVYLNCRLLDLKLPPEVISAILTRCVTLTSPTNYTKCLRLKNGHWALEMEALQGEMVNAFMPKDKNGPLSANQGLSTAKLRHFYAFFTLCMGEPTSSCPTLSTHAPIFKGHCWKWHHRTGMTLYGITGQFCLSFVTKF